MLVPRIQKPIPKRLSHHTKLAACKSILSDTDGRGICLWAFSNKYKNDDKEIKMGEFMLKQVRKVAFEKSLLQQFDGYENSASVSFMEGESTIGMLEKYGSIRLEFDLREHVSLEPFSGGFMNCEYVAEDELCKYADEYCTLLKQQQDLMSSQKENKEKTLPALFDYLMMETDIICKVFTIKEEKWHEEKEWRQVFLLKEYDPNIKQTLDGKPYKEFYLPKETLTGVTILYEKDPFEHENEKIELEAYLKEKGYNIKIKTQKVQ